MITLQRLTDNAFGYKDDRYPARWIDAFGTVQKALIDSTWRAGDWTVTATGTSPITASLVPDAVALITTPATEYAGDNIQYTGTQFKLEAGKPCYFGAKLTISDATESDLLFGLCGVDTTLTAADTAHAIAVGASGVFFSKLDGVTAGYFKTYSTATETNSVSAFTADTNAHVYEMFWDGTSLIGYLDGVSVGCFTSVPTAVLTPSLNFRAEPLQRLARFTGFALFRQGDNMNLIAPMVDLFTGFLTQITGDHRYIHEGKAFSVIGNTGSVAAAGTYTVALKTPVSAKGYVHLRPAIIAASANVTSFVVTEGATVTGGSAVVPINLNRNKANVSQVTVTAGVTISVAGTTVISQDVVGAGGATPARSGGAGGSEHERVLKPDTTYSLTFTVIGASTASTAYYDIFWYEEGSGK